LDESIEAFFRGPSLPLPKGKVSGLYRLRFAIQEAAKLSCKKQDRDHDSGAVLWLAAMGVLTGIDLLSQLREGKEEHGGKYFKNFASKFIVDSSCKSEKHGKILYALRNALHHTFSLYDKHGNSPASRFVLSQSHGPLIERVREDATDGSVWYRVNIRKLQRHFESGVCKLKEELLKRDASAKRLFVDGLENKGWVHIDPTVKDGDAHMLYHNRGTTSSA